MQANHRDVIDYWLGEAQRDPSTAKARSKLWYRVSSQTDNQIRDRFGKILELAEQSKLNDWLDSPEGHLAMVILLDQFTRNINRGSSDAWKNDAMALNIATSCIDKGDHLSLSYFGRVFLYHPFHHAESIAAQERAVDLFDELHDEAPPEWQTSLKGFAEFSRGHRDIVSRFGRFPHRNKTLGRQSTLKEAQYLEENSKKYDQ